VVVVVVAIGLVLAGDGPQRAALARRARAVNLRITNDPDARGAPPGGVCFCGMVDSTAKIDLFTRAAIVALSSDATETYPVVLLEAMAAGRPIVAGDIHCARQVRAERSLICVAGDTPDAWADAIGSLLDDPAGAEAMGRRALKLALDHDWSVIAPRYIEVYARATGALPPATAAASERS
jgi:glycosyltransferase involved in cell wall biosynthesis